MLFIVRYLFGFVRIVVSGPYENFLNLLSKRGVTMWGTKKHEKLFEISVPRSQVDLVEKSALRSSVHIESMCEHGLVSTIKRHKHKLSLLAGIGMFALVIHVLSLYVWVVQVEGNASISSDDIMAVASEIGLKEGVLKRSLPVSHMEQELLLRFQDLSWMSINVQGCIASIVVKERFESKNFVPDDTECHLVAKMDGEIAEIQVQQGTAEVKVGDTVTKGTLLVSGIRDEEDSDIVHTCHATAKVMANTFHEFHTSVDMYQERVKRVGKRIAMKKLRLFGIDIPLTPTTLPENMENFSLQREDKVAEIFNVKLPFAVHTDLWTEEEKEMERISEQEAYQILNEKIEEFEKNELHDIQITYKEQDDKFTDDKLYTSIMYYCSEDIAEQVPLNEGY